MFKTAPYKAPSLGFSDLLNYGALIDDGVILNKDGSLTAGFKFAGADVSSSTIEQRNDLLMRVNKVLCSFGTGWMTHVDAIRHRVPDYLDTSTSAFPHVVFSMIDNERQDFYQHISSRFDSAYYLFLTYMPPSKAKSNITNLMFEQNGNRKTGFGKHVDFFKTSLREAFRTLSTYIKITELKAYKKEGEFYCQLLEALNHSISGEYRPVRLPFTPIGIDTLLGSHDLWTGLNPKIDNQLMQVLSINDFPDLSVPNMLYHLDKLNLDYRWSTRFSFFDAIDAEKALVKEQKKWKQKIISFKDVMMKNPNPKINTDALRMFEQYSAAAEAIKTNGIQYGHYTSTIVILGKTPQELEDKTELVVNTIKHCGFNALIESVNAMDAYLGSLPSDSLHNVRRPLVNTLNLAAMLPMSAQWTGRITNPCDLYPKNSPSLMQCGADGNAPFWLNLHHNDLGHTLCFGPSGAGKSTLLTTLVSQALRYPNSQHFIMDKDYSAYTISQCGGVHYDICKDSEISFAPLSKLRTDFDWTVEYIYKLLSLQNLHVSSAQKNTISTTLRELADTPDLEHITLSEFVNVADIEIADALTYYTHGSAGALLNNQTDSFKTASLQVFEIGEIMGRGEQELIPILLYLFRQIELSLNGHPAFLWIDEAWIAFKHPIFRAMIEEWLRVLRKKNCVVALFTQSLGEVLNSDISEMLLTACPTKIYLPNVEADNNVIKPIYQSFGLNDRQIDIIKNAMPKRDYYITQPDGNRLFKLDLGELALAFVAKSSKHDVAAVKEHVSQYGDLWYQHWLVTQGVIDEQTRLSIT